MFWAESDVFDGRRIQWLLPFMGPAWQLRHFFALYLYAYKHRTMYKHAGGLAPNGRSTLFNKKKIPIVFSIFKITELVLSNCHSTRSVVLVPFSYFLELLAPYFLNRHRCILCLQIFEFRFCHDRRLYSIAHGLHLAVKSCRLKLILYWPLQVYWAYCFWHWFCFLMKALLSILL